MKEYKTEFVLKVNEIYFNIEKSDYRDKHPEIFIDEAIRWQEIGKKFISSNSEKICLLDIGSGTGFVPLQIGAFLKKNDLFICADISANMLAVCKEGTGNEKFRCRFEYIKLDGKQINLESNSVNYITLNSVLHHVPNYSTFFKEVNRLLRTNGYLIIGHEPNKPFYTHKFLWNNYRYISLVVQPRRFIPTVLRVLKLTEIAKRFRQSFKQETQTQNGIVEHVNKRLLREGIIKTPLTDSQMTEIVEIYSPTAGGYHKDRGIDISEILRDYLPNFKIEHLDTYNHLCKVSSENKFTKWYDLVLKKRFPETGATFLAILKKVN